MVSITNSSNINPLSIRGRTCDRLHWEVTSFTTMPVADLDEFTKVLSFPQTYITKAIMFIPYSEIMEPFQAWYDLEANASRVDYYGGIYFTLVVGRR